MFDTLLTREEVSAIQKAPGSALLRDGEDYRSLGTMRMTVKEWATIPDNPIQRDTIARAKRAKHLDVFEPVHADVNMAVLPDGTRYKLDGHTRVFKWMQGRVENAPEFVHVRVWQARDERAVRALYEKFDSRAAVETSVDQLSGAVRAAGLDFKTPLLKSNRYANAVKILWAECSGAPTGHGRQTTATQLAEAVRFFKEELQLLDSIGPTKNRFNGGHILAALACFLIDGKDAVPFWRDFQNDRGTKDGETRDPIEALSVAKSNEKAKGALADYIFLRKGVAAYLAHRSHQVYSQGIKGGSLETTRKLLRKAFSEKMKTQQSFL